jgi:leucine-rich repeat protein SHOC2
MGLTEVPSELFRMNNVKRLYLPNNKLCSLPSEISHLPNLNVLTVRLSKRLDRVLPLSRCFQVDGNELTSLPSELFLLTNLKLLYVRHSRQMDLDLTNVVFQVRSNKLTSLPAEIGQLVQLEWLRVRNSN